MSRSDGDTSALWVGYRHKQLALPIVGGDANDLRGKGDGVALVASHQLEEGVIGRLVHVGAPLCGKFFSRDVWGGRLHLHPSP